MKIYYLLFLILIISLSVCVIEGFIAHEDEDSLKNMDIICKQVEQLKRKAHYE